MTRILVLNGPNLNALGRREPEKYGHRGLSDLASEWKEWGESRGVEVLSENSNSEGELLDILHRCEEENSVQSVVLNPGALTHTSRALRDCLASLSIPVIEVHLTNIAKREAWRQHSVVSEVCLGTVSGFGADSYRLGLEAALNLVREST